MATPTKREKNKRKEVHSFRFFAKVKKVIKRE
jgi:hypothetical protein